MSIEKVLKTFKVMGGEFQIQSFAPLEKHQQIEELFDKAFAEVKRIEQKFSEFKDSPFNEINKNAGLKKTKVDSETLKLVKKSLEISRETKGLFDISFASLAKAWREAKSENKMLSEQERQSFKKLVNYKLIEVDEDNKTVFLPYKEMRISLGGIGKGYAVDRAFEVLRSHGLSNFYINGSGDIRVHSDQSAPRKWKVGIRNPFSADPKSCGLVQIANGSVSTSGSYVNEEHIIHPKSLKNRKEIVSATVLAEDAITTDTIGTILMNKSKSEALDYLDKNNLNGILIDREGHSHLSKEATKNFGL